MGPDSDPVYVAPSVLALIDAVGGNEFTSAIAADVAGTHPGHDAPGEDDPTLISQLLVFGGRVTPDDGNPTVFADGAPPRRLAESRLHAGEATSGVGQI
jgi:hypothetical protein